MCLCIERGEAALSVEIPFSGPFQYSRAELIADGIVHAVGIVLAISAGSILLAFSIFHTGPGNTWPRSLCLALLTVLSISCAYNLWPVSRAKWVLRRFDHAAIYLLIAGTYTPFLAQSIDGVERVLGVDEGGDAAQVLGLGDDVQSQRGLAGRLRP